MAKQWIPKGAVPYQEPMHTKGYSPQNTNTLVDQLPNIGGVGGATIAGVASSPLEALNAFVPGLGVAANLGVASIGSGIGGGIGQATQDVVRGKTPGMDVVQAGEQQAPYGLLEAGRLAEIPGKAIADRIAPSGMGVINKAIPAISKILGNTAGGYAAGGLNALAGGATPQQAQAQGRATGNINAVAGVGGTLAKKFGNFIWGNFPKEVTDRLEKLPKAAKVGTKLNLAIKDAAQLVGSQNLPYAIDNGIVPVTTLQKELKAAGLPQADIDRLGLTGEAEGNQLIASTPHTHENSAQLVSTIKDRRKIQATNVENRLQNILQGIKTSDPQHMKNDLLSEFNPTERMQNPTLYKKLYGMVQNAGLKTVQDINTLKRQIGDFWNNDEPGIANTLYSKLKSAVEDEAGKLNDTRTEAIKGLNQEAAQLRNMRLSLAKMDKPGATAPRSQADINSMMGESAGKAETSGHGGKTTTGIGSWFRNLPPSVQRMHITLGIGAALGAITGSHLMSNALGGTSTSLGLYFGAAAAARALTETPTGQLYLKNLIEKGAKPTDAVGKSILQALARGAQGKGQSNIQQQQQMQEQMQQPAMGQ